MSEDPPPRAETRQPLQRIDKFFAEIAGVALMVMMLLTVVSSAGRYLFSMPIPDMVTINEMLLVCVVFLPMAFTQLLHEHVEVTLFTDTVSTIVLRRFIAFGCLIGLSALTLLAYSMGKGAYRAFNTGDLNFGVFQIYTWPARTVACLGVSLLAIRLLIEFISLMKPAKQNNPKSAKS